MSDKLKAYLQVDNGDDLCLICGKELGKDSVVISKSETAWTNLKTHAKAWSEVPIEPGEKIFEFTLVHGKVDGVEKAFGKRHSSFECRGNFGKVTLREKMKEIKAEKNKQLIDNETESSQAVAVETPMPSHRTRSVTGNPVQFERICFICNEIRTCEDNKYREGGLAVCEYESAASKLESVLKLIDESHRFYAARERLELLSSGHSKDIYSAEIRYHQSCYLKFVNVRTPEDEDIAIQRDLHDNALGEFCSKIELNIVQRKNASQ